MTAQIALTLGSIGAAVALFAVERLCIDVFALLVLLALALGRGLDAGSQPGAGSRLTLWLPLASAAR